MARGPLPRESVTSIVCAASRHWAGGSEVHIDDDAIAGYEKIKGLQLTDIARPYVLAYDEA